MQIYAYVLSIDKICSNFLMQLVSAKKTTSSFSLKIVLLFGIIILSFLNIDPTRIPFGKFISLIFLLHNGELEITSASIT